MSFPTPSPVAGHRGHGHDSYRCLRLKSHIRRITGDGADLVIDPVGGPYAEPALRACRWGGRFVCVGFAAGEIPRIPLDLGLLKGITVRGFELRTLAGHLPERVRTARPPSPGWWPRACACPPFSPSKTRAQHWSMWPPAGPWARS
ncbi:MAG: NADPH:quinone reductase [Streptosporangiaceae bacterium]|nr:NADPH:quinone reductase [Streptosporangiaceae bacterium]